MTKKRTKKSESDKAIRNMGFHGVDKKLGCKCVALKALKMKN